MPSIRWTTVSSCVSRRVLRELSVEVNALGERETDDKQTKQQKYQELEKIQFRPMYLDAQATTPMVSHILVALYLNDLLFTLKGSSCARSNVAIHDTHVWQSTLANTRLWLGE